MSHMHEPIGVVLFPESPLRLEDMTAPIGAHFIRFAHKVIFYCWPSQVDGAICKHFGKQKPLKLKRDFKRVCGVGCTKEFDILLFSCKCAHRVLADNKHLLL